MIVRWRLLLKEYHPKIICVARVDNGAAGTSFCLDITYNKSDLSSHTERENRHLEYVTLSLVICIFMSKSSFSEDDGTKMTSQETGNSKSKMIG